MRCLTIGVGHGQSTPTVLSRPHYSSRLVLSRHSSPISLVSRSNRGGSHAIVSGQCDGIVLANHEWDSQSSSQFHTGRGRQGLARSTLLYLSPSRSSTSPSPFHDAGRPSRLETIGILLHLVPVATRILLARPLSQFEWFCHHHQPQTRTRTTTIVAKCGNSIRCLQSITLVSVAKGTRSDPSHGCCIQKEKEEE